MGNKVIFTLDKMEDPASKTKRTEGEGTTEYIHNYQNKVYVTCPDAAGAEDTCKIVTKSGTYSEYYCTGPHCSVDYQSTQVFRRKLFKQYNNYPI